jgi:branched-chain amino acid transport system substrate-binding protein
VPAGALDLRATVEKVKSRNPDVVFLLVYAKEGAAFLKQARVAGIVARMYGSDNLSASEFLAAGAETIEGVRVALPTPAGGESYDRFVTKYRSKYNEEPDVMVLKSYDSMMTAIKAMRDAGVEPGAIRNRLRSDEFSYQGVTGEIRFDQNGDLRSQQYRRMIYRAGKLVSPVS